MSEAGLKPVDIRILDALQSDGRMTNQALAENIGLATSPCWRRVHQLEQTGVIQGYRANLSRQKLGLGVLAFVRVKIDSHNAEEA
jgi:Lrp/AsnC family transcriptional regulator, leucine-responsive regulatory protein